MRRPRPDARIVALILLLSVAVRVVHYVQAYPGPAFEAHTWDQGDMSFFHRVAMRIAGGDLWLDGVVQPRHDWMLEVSADWLRSHPREAEALSGLAARTGEPAGSLLWARWLGGKRFYQEPLYAYAMAGIYALAGPDVRAIFLVQMALGVLTNLLVYLTTLRVFGKRAALFAATGAILYPPLLFYELTLLRATGIVFLTAALLFASSRAIADGTPRWWAVSGLVCGFGMSLKMTFLPLALGLLLHPLLDRGRAGRRRLAAAGLFAAACLAPLSPIAVRNVLVGVPPWEVANGAMNFAMGNAAGLDVRLGSPAYAFPELGGILGRSGGRFAATVVETLRTYAHPLDYLRVLARKLMPIWHWYEIPNNVNFYYAQLHAPILRWLPIRFELVASLAALGVVLYGKRNRRQWPFVGTIVVTSLVLVLFAHNSRFRLPMVPALLPFAGYGLSKGIDGLRERRWKPVIGAAAAVAGLLAFMARPLPDGATRIRRTDYVVGINTYYYPRAEALSVAGRWNEAADVLAEALKRSPPYVRDPQAATTGSGGDREVLGNVFAAVRRRRADCLQRAGRTAEAARELELATRLEGKGGDSRSEGFLPD